MAKSDRRIPADELPVGLAMALAMDSSALSAFAGLDAASREEIVTRARMAQSKADMREIVASLSGVPPLV